MIALEMLIYKLMNNTITVFINILLTSLFSQTHVFRFLKKFKMFNNKLLLKKKL